MRSYSISEVVYGLRNHEMRLALEPQVNLKTGEVVGMECLVRWRHPRDGMVGPAAFLPQLDACGLMTPLTFEVLARMLSVRKKLRSVGYSGRFSINVSNKTLLDWTFARDVARIAEEHGESLGGVTFEITESSMAADDSLCSESMQALIKLGIGLSLDDFWTGYSSLNKPALNLFGEVKVDHKLTSKIHEDRVALAGVASIVTFAKNLNWHCVIEGIEKAETIHRLLEFGCEIGQGYFLSKPIPEDEIVQWFVSSTVDRCLSTAVWSDAASFQPKALRVLDDALMEEIGAMRVPVWCFNLDRMCMEWANSLGVVFWRAESLVELQNRNFTDDMSTAARERLNSFKQRLSDGSQFAEQWTVFPRGIPTPVYCVFSLIRSSAGEHLLLIKGFKGFLSIPKSIDRSQFAEAASLPAVAMTLDARIYWRNVAAVRQFGADSQFLRDIVTQTIEGTSLLDRLIACGEITQDIMIDTGQYESRFCASARMIRDQGSGDWSILVYLTPICDLRGCSLSSTERKRSVVIPIESIAGAAMPEAG